MTGDAEGPSPASTNGQSVSLFLQWDPCHMSLERHLVQPLWGQQGLVGGAWASGLGLTHHQQGPPAILA